VRAADSSEVRTQCDVSAPARLSARVVTPRYPDILLQAGVEGSVLAFVDVDTSGRPLMERLTRARATHELFWTAVKSAIAGWRFEPARTDGNAVGVRLAIEVEFHSPTPPIFVAREDSTVTSLADGVRMTIGWKSFPADTSYHPDRSARDGATRAMVRYALATLVTRRPRQRVCAESGVGDSLQLAAQLRKDILRETGIEIFDRRRCPRTYASMIASNPPRPQPKGHVDPIWLTIRTKAWSRDFFSHSVRWESGTSGTERECVTRKSPTSPEWSAYCSGTVRKFLY
jgi:hypothetical protein